jgi:hypothetical protein
VKLNVFQSGRVEVTSLSSRFQGRCSSRPTCSAINISVEVKASSGFIAKVRLEILSFAVTALSFDLSYADDRLEFEIRSNRSGHRL